MMDKDRIRKERKDNAVNALKILLEESNTKESKAQRERVIWYQKMNESEKMNDFYDAIKMSKLSIKK